MQLNTTNVLLVILGIILVLCFVLMIMNDNNQIEPFDPVVDAIQQQLQNENPDQLKSTIKTLQQRLIDYGYSPDLNNYVRKTELNPNSGKCIVATAEDRDKYVSKSDVPAAGPRIDLSQYVKKSSIPPAPVCPPAPEIDYSAYVKKSTLPPLEKCPPCIAPKVKVSAGLCRECPPAPVCPPPERCPELKCPPPAPCPPAPTCTPCDEVRYIKVPTVITKTVMVDANGKVISQQINSGNTTNTVANASVPTQPLTNYTNLLQSYIQPSSTQASGAASATQASAAVSATQASAAASATQASGAASATKSHTFLNNIFSSGTQIPNTTFPTMSLNNPNIPLAQTLDSNDSNSLCPSADLNSEFKKYGIYGL